MTMTKTQRQPTPKQIRRRLDEPAASRCCRDLDEVPRYLGIVG